MATTLTSIKANNVLLTDILDITKDIVISGEFSCFGSDTFGGEGFCVYFINAFSSNNVGSPGPGLGFAPTDGIIEYLGNDIFQGTENSILGVGFDITGNFSQSLGPDYNGDISLHPNAITLRYGSTQDFNYISSSINLSSYGIDIYQVYGDHAPSQTSTPTPTSTQTPTTTFTNTNNTTATATKTNTPTNTTTSTQTRSNTPTQTKTQSPTSNLANVLNLIGDRDSDLIDQRNDNVIALRVPLPGVTRTPTNTKTRTPTTTGSITSTSTQTPTVTGLYPIKKAFKIRLTNYSKKIIVYIRNNNTSQFQKVFEQDNLNLTLPTGYQCQVGLSYSTGVKLSKFYLYNFVVNGIGYTNPYTPTPSATLIPVLPVFGFSGSISLPSLLATTPTQTPTQTETPSQTPTQTRSQTSFVTPTQTRSQTQTATQTSSQTATQTATQTRSRTPAPTYVITSTTSAPPFIAAPDASYKFVFESKWSNADSAAQAVNVLINNARFGLTKNEGSNNLLNIRATTTGSGVVNDFDRKYFRSYFFDGAAEFGQEIGANGVDGLQSWLEIPFVERISSSNNPLTDFRSGISSNIYQALKILIGTGSTLDETLLYIDKLDNSNERPNPSDNAGANFNIWGIDGLTNDYKTCIFDSSTNNRYVINFNNTGRILYNFDYIDGITVRDDFITTIDTYRLVPNTRYLRVTNQEIDISFSYCTELISYIDRTTGSISYWGARLTLFTKARQ